jgi:hypothetical protein
MLIQSSSRNKPELDILRDIYSNHLSDMVGDKNTLGIWCLMSCTILQMSKYYTVFLPQCEVMHSMIIHIYALKETCISSVLKQFVHKVGFM